MCHKIKNIHTFFKKLILVGYVSTLKLKAIFAHLTSFAKYFKACSSKIKKGEKIFIIFLAF